MNPNEVRTTLEQIVAATLARWPSQGADEVGAVNRQLRYGGTPYEFVSNVVPKFITGDPQDVAVTQHGYILVVGLNHRYVANAGDGVAADYAALGQGVNAHLEACLGYFRRPAARIYPYFTQFEHVLAGFNEALGLPFDLYGSLKTQVLFVDHLPYFSERSGEYPGQIKQQAAVDNRHFVATLIANLPPRAIWLCGKAAMDALDEHPAAPFGGVHDYATEYSRTVTRDGPFSYRIGSLATPGGPVPVLASKFIRRRYGPNSIPQQRELGALLANR